MDTNIATILKAIAYTENGGAPDISNPKAGKTGEMKSIFQYEPSTWAAESKQVSGQDNLPMTPENEALVAYHVVGNDLQKGLTPQQIFSSWNAGPGEPDAYTGKFSDGSPSKGVNEKYGVNYDVPGYVDKAMKYYSEFQQGGNQNTPDGNMTQPPQAPASLTGQTTNPAPQTPPSPQMNMPQANPGLLGNVKPLV